MWRKWFDITISQVGELSQIYFAYLWNLSTLVEFKEVIRRQILSYHTSENGALYSFTCWRSLKIILWQKEYWKLDFVINKHFNIYLMCHSQTFRMLFLFWFTQILNSHRQWKLSNIWAKYFLSVCDVIQKRRSFLCCFLILPMMCYDLLIM